MPSKTAVSAKTFTGIVVSNKMTRTVVVEIERRVMHPIYHKILKKSGTIKADTGEFDIKIGQKVTIQATRPISRDKHFKVIKILEDKK